MLGRMWRKGALTHCWQECRLVVIMENSMAVSQNILKTELSYHPAISQLGIHQKELKATS